MKALEKGWESAGFEVTLEPFGKDYFAKAAQPATARTVDVFWSNWGADWPSASTVLPPLFDSRTNLTSTSNGRDYGAVKDVRTNATFDRASAMRSSRRRAGLWASADIRPPSCPASSNSASPQYSSVSTRVPSMSNSTARSPAAVAGVSRSSPLPATRRV